jgi:MSHA biogenesis protein MshI
MGLFRKTERQPGLLALSINSQGARFTYLRRAAAGLPAVLRCEFHRLSEVDTETLDKLRKQARLEQYRCTTLLNAGEYQMLQVEAPNVPKEELKAAIRWRIKDLLGYHVDDAMIDVLDIPPQKDAPARNHSMYAIAAPNKVIHNRVALFEEAKIPLSVIDIPEMAQRNIAALFERDGKGLALLSFDNDGGLLTFTCRGELYLSRRIEVTLGQLNDADEDLRKHNFDRVVLEVQRSLDYFDRNYDFISVAKLLLSPLLRSIGLPDYLAANLYVPVETANLASVLDFTATPELNDMEVQMQFFHVLGAALRLEEKVL